MVVADGLRIKTHHRNQPNKTKTVVCTYVTRQSTSVIKVGVTYMYQSIQRVSYVPWALRLDKKFQFISKVMLLETFIPLGNQRIKQ